MEKPEYVHYAGCAVAFGASAGALSVCTATAGISLSCGWVILAF